MAVVVLEWTEDGRCPRCREDLGSTEGCGNCEATRGVWAKAGLTEDPEPEPVQTQLTAIKRSIYLDILGALLNRDPAMRKRAARVREANVRLYRSVVEPQATAAEAHLALAEAAEQERRR